MLDSLFLEDIRQPFSAKRFGLARPPIEGFVLNLAKPQRRWESRNHWMIKSRASEAIILDDLEPDVRRFCQKAIEYMQANRLPIKDRYLYLTVDDRHVEAGRTQRQPGWHFDGMQGSEVPSVNPGCFQFLWCDHTPALYATQSFQTKGLDRHRVNFFDSLGNQVKEDSLIQGKPGLAYLMSAYQVHRASEVAVSGRRKVLRLSASYQPITSKRMTVNPHIGYDYPIHSTSGRIPEGLKVLYGKLESKAA